MKLVEKQAQDLAAGESIDFYGTVSKVLRIKPHTQTCRPGCQCYELLISGSAMQYVYRFENETVKVFESTEI